ncbi:fungal-specific transcription factor domain-containing protein [Apiosordaria backusii]|uniref:Fungal-specific transcription factor domain-containing protein n=1 Tax=Apiosordaria backusii TaxID=314023 RepID=A0AA40K3T8_9PEZI|nr:fungal-specific transcription factor domain-containing protein [Apiosordaria backusii]
MKNRQKSRTGCRTCKVRRLRCDEAKPACENCLKKGFQCPGYQQRLQWSTKHERPTVVNTTGPDNFTQLVTAASASIVKSVSPAANPSGNGAIVSAASATTPNPAVSRESSSAPRSATLSASPPPSSFTLSPPPQSEASVEDTNGQDGGTLVPVARKNGVLIPTSRQQEPMMFQQVVDIPTFLIEHWFKSVCCSWSAFDSQANPYRRLTSALWNTSTPVFYALQAISAASLVERLPHVIKDTARAAPRKAAEAIHKELVAFSTGYRPRFPVELLLSLFCMSSSMCWMESRQLGQHYVRQAHNVLKLLDGQTLNPESQQLLEFFKGCLLYEEALRSVVSEEEIDFSNMLSWAEPTDQGPLVSATPHAWTGVSADVFRLFGKAVALCRRSRTRWRHNDGTSYRVLQGAMRDIQEATLVEESLLAIEISLVETNLTPDTASNVSTDLYNATQAYRLSSLLQLYETFPDLVAKRMPDLTDQDGSVMWNTWVSPLALHVTEVLRALPVGSMRCIQPLLCLCAGSGLRFDKKVPLGRGHQSFLLSTESTTTTTTTPPPTSGIVPNADFSFTATPEISENAIKTSQARSFIMARLDQLENSLPPKPIGVAKQLLRAVWTAYDGEIGLARRTHWLDVMSQTGLHSLFG